MFFSVGGKLYPGDPIAIHVQEDCIFEDSKNMSIKLHQRIGRYVKIQFFWASKKWLLISEITFDSRKPYYTRLLLCYHLRTYDNKYAW